MRYLYSKWDGSDEFEITQDELMDELSRSTEDFEVFKTGQLTQTATGRQKRI